MKKQNILLMIYFSAIIFAFSSCKKNAAENNQSKLAISPPPNKTLTIKEIDFKNFTYPDKAGKNVFTLTNGEESFGQMKDIAFSLKNIEYADLTDDKQDEAIIHISVQYGAGSSGLLYVYTLKDNKPKILWYIESGYGAEGELKNAYAENNELIIELFGDTKFDEATGEFKFPKLTVFPKNLDREYTFTKFRFKWNKEKFFVDGKPKLFNFKAEN